MDMGLLFKAILIGIVEGLTEFLPISSTGHMILAGHLIGFDGKESFEIIIQLGAILAICVLYFHKLWGVARHLFTDSQAQRFTLAVTIAFIPAVILGLLLHDVAKSLFTVPVVGWSLLLGGVFILVAERMIPTPKIHSVEEMGMLTALKIGLCQCLAFVPGISRSGASIYGAVFNRVDRKTAAEFSFFLAIPTMLGASALDILKSWHEISAQDSSLIAVGFVTAFVTALLVVRWLVRFVSTHGFALFGWYRIVAGILVLRFLT